MGVGEFIYVDQAYTGENSADAAGEHGIELEVVKLQTEKIRALSSSSILQQTSWKQLPPAQRRVERKHGQRQDRDERRHAYPGVPHQEVERDREIVQRESSKK